MFNPEPGEIKVNNKGKQMPTKAMEFPVEKLIRNGKVTRITVAGSPMFCMSVKSSSAAPEVSIVALYSITAKSRSRILGSKPYLRDRLRSSLLAFCCNARSTRVRGKAIAALSPSRTREMSNKTGHAALSIPSGMLSEWFSLLEDGTLGFIMRRVIIIPSVADSMAMGRKVIIRVVSGMEKIMLAAMMAGYTGKKSSHICLNQKLIKVACSGRSFILLTRSRIAVAETSAPPGMGTKPIIEGVSKRASLGPILSMVAASWVSKPFSSIRRLSVIAQAIMTNSLIVCSSIAVLKTSSGRERSGRTRNETMRLPMKMANPGWSFSLSNIMIPAIDINKA